MPTPLALANDVTAGHNPPEATCRFRRPTQRSCINIPTRPKQETEIASQSTASGGRHRGHDEKNVAQNLSVMNMLNISLIYDTTVRICERQYPPCRMDGYHWSRGASGTLRLLESSCDQRVLQNYEFTLSGVLHAALTVRSKKTRVFVLCYELVLI